MTHWLELNLKVKKIHIFHFVKNDFKNLFFTEFRLHQSVWRPSRKYGAGLEDRGRVMKVYDLPEMAFYIFYHWWHCYYSTAAKSGLTWHLNEGLFGRKYKTLRTQMKAILIAKLGQIWHPNEEHSGRKFTKKTLHLNEGHLTAFTKLRIKFWGV